jgi:tetratricopeptide (TPR) repeat protein
MLEMLRVIREQEPSKPSTKLSTADGLPTLAANRGTEPAKLMKLLRGELDWIVMKALEKDRNRRYETANGFAMDVQRYLADEPVLACPPSATYRMRKFARRNKTTLTTLVAMALAILLGSALSIWYAVEADKSRKQAEQAKNNEIAERHKAEAAQEQAMDALRATTDEVVEKLLGAKPALGPAEKEFVESTMKRWQTFAAQQGEGELAQRARAEGFRRVAYLRAKLGQEEEARAGYQDAIAGYAQLSANFPAVPQYRRELAKSHHNLGATLTNLGKHTEAESAFRQALAIYEKLVAEFPAVPEYQQELATNDHTLGFMLDDLGARAEAEAALRHGLAIREKLAADFPAVAQYRLELAMSHKNLGKLLRELGQRAEAESACRKALAIHENLSAEYSAVPRFRVELARTLNGLGMLFGRSAEREAAIRQALGIYKKLAAEYPAVPQYCQELAISHNNLGKLLTELGKLAEAESAYRQALAIQEQLAADYPAVPRYREDLANHHTNLGSLLRDLNKCAEAEQAFRHALAIREKLATDFPAVPQYRIDLGGSQCNIGLLRRDSNLPEQALPWFDKAIATLEEVLHQVKVDVTARLFLRNAHWGRALALDDLKRHAEAARDWDKAVEFSPEAERTYFRVRRALNRGRAGQLAAAIQEAEEVARNADANTLYNAAAVLTLAAGREDEAGDSLSKEECAQRAVSLLRQAVAKGYKDAEHMKSDHDLKALRERDDFKKLLAELETKLQK